MSSELLQLSLCNGIDYSTLTANISVIKCILDCDTDGNAVIDSTISDILIALFGKLNPGAEDPPWVFNPLFPPQNGIWYGSTGDSSDAPYSYTIAPGFSCFKELYIFYYSKSCKTDNILWIPEIEGCILEAMALIKLEDNLSLGVGGYKPLGFDDINPANLSADDMAPFTTYKKIKWII